MGINYENALRRYVRSQISPFAVLTDISVRWDEGGVGYDPTYGDETHTAPTFSVDVTYTIDGREKYMTLDTARTMTALLHALLAIGDT